MRAITTSIFDLLKIGPGPSSSHTIGPMRASNDFLRLLSAQTGAVANRARRVRILLYGSLSDTGLGHGTHRALLAGLLGHAPETCSAQILDELDLSPKASHPVAAGAVKAVISPSNIVFTTLARGTRRSPPPSFPHSNTMVFQLLDEDGGLLCEREYYSIGGGFIEWKGRRPERQGRPRYPYANTVQLRRQLDRHRKTIPELMLANEIAITGQSPDAIRQRLDAILAAMLTCVKNGLATEGYLPGPIHLHRKGPLMHQRAQRMARGSSRSMVELCAYAFAASEENAVGHPVVTAPTCGSAGVLPAVLQVLRHHDRIRHEALRDALWSAAAVGFICKHNASISGAEVGCQGEIGVAASMAAAFIAAAHGCPFEIAENAAETALEHHLGMTCDPVGGFVQIPCIERNAMGAVKAYAAYWIAREGIPEWHVVGLDKAVKAMAMTGRDMPAAYKETARSGLARCC